MEAAVLAWRHPPLADGEFKLEGSVRGEHGVIPVSDGATLYWQPPELLQLLTPEFLLIPEQQNSGGMGPFPINVATTRSADCQSVR
jgi:hypothetical protein